MAHLAAKAVRKVLFAIARPRAIRSDRFHAKTPWKQDLPLKVGRICLFLILREIIALELEVESEAMFSGEIEVDESYFGGSRMADVVAALLGKYRYSAY